MLLLYDNFFYPSNEILIWGHLGGMTHVVMTEIEIEGRKGYAVLAVLKKSPRIKLEVKGLEVVSIEDIKGLP